MADDGSLAYVAGDAAPNPQDTLVWVDRRGKETPIPGVPPHFTFYAPRLSPEDDRVAVTIYGEETATYLWDFAGLTKLTPHQEFNEFPVWSHDGRDVAYSARREGREEVYWQPWDRPGESRLLTQGSAGGVVPLAFSPDGTRLVTRNGSRPPVISVFVLPADRKSTATQEDSFQGGVAGLAALSGDGRWIAYESADSGRPEVWVRAFPEVNKTRGKQVSTNGGTRPVWSRSTNELFFVEPGGPSVGPAGSTSLGSGRLMVVPIKPGTTLSNPWPSTCCSATPSTTWRLAVSVRGETTMSPRTVSSS